MRRGYVVRLQGNALNVVGSVMERRARVVADILAYAAKTWTALTVRDLALGTTKPSNGSPADPSRNISAFT